MAHINLLPWREAQRKQKKKDFFVVIGVFVGLMAAIVATVHFYMASLIENQTMRNNILKNEIQLVEQKIKEIKELEKQKEQLIARMRVIDELQSNRPTVVHMFDDLAKIVPEGLFIESITQSVNKITIKGQAQSNARVSAFMRALEKSEWFTKPSLEVINAAKKETRQSREFTLTVLQDSPKGGEK